MNQSITYIVKRNTTTYHFPFSIFSHDEVVVELELVRHGGIHRHVDDAFSLLRLVDPISFYSERIPTQVNNNAYTLCLCVWMKWLNEYYAQQQCKHHLVVDAEDELLVKLQMIGQLCWHS